MKIYINDQEHDVANHVSIHYIVTETLSLRIDGIAVAINETVVPQSIWKTSQLSENDRLLIIKACSGG
jgi:sulfur carrier protein